MVTNQRFQNQIKKKSGFCSFSEEEFDAYLAKWSKKIWDCCSLSEETNFIFYLSVRLNIAYYKSYSEQYFSDRLLVDLL